MGIYLSIYETVGVVLDKLGFEAWQRKVDPDGELYGEEYEDKIVGDFDGLGLLSAGGYDEEGDYFVYVDRLFTSHAGGRGGTGGVLGSGGVDLNLTHVEHYELIAMAQELGTSEPQVRSIVALNWS